jgi:hypothetical protein
MVIFILVKSVKTDTGFKVFIGENYRLFFFSLGNKGVNNSFSLGKTQKK